jgi:sporulation protein YlmC with PRC-barrel domain
MRLSRPRGTVLTATLIGLFAIAVAPPVAAQSHGDPAIVAEEAAAASARDEFRLSEVLGARVVDEWGEAIGEVVDLVIENGHIAAALVEGGAFLGIGGNRVAVSTENIEISRSVDGIVEIVVRESPRSAASVEANGHASPSAGTGASDRENGRFAVRLFAAPGQYPPSDYAAYGIVAFPALALASDRARHLAICSAYAAVLRPSDLVDAPTTAKMVTVWPVEDADTAAAVNAAGRRPDCAVAVDRYGIALAKEAIDHARRAGHAMSGRGPFLMAWAPTSQIGAEDAIILNVDLSNVTTEAHALDIFLDWERDIVMNPELWDDGWSLEKVRVAVRLWADRYGEQIMSLLE